MEAPECLFCRIVAGDLPAQRVREDEQTIAFRDINPQASTHVLVIPRRHIPSVNDLNGVDAGLVGRLFLSAKAIAAEEGIEETGYRLVMNSGVDAGQSVDHIHLHLLGGRRLSWPPG
jgi:histidine triad (HIT) family protein